jgi:hypothetical protein
MVTISDDVMLLIAWLSFRRDPPPSAPLIRFAVDSARIVEVSCSPNRANNCSPYARHIDLRVSLRLTRVHRLSISQPAQN